MWKQGTWRKGKKTVTGSWCYNWHSQRFHIQLNGKDRITGRPRTAIVSGDSPEFNGWTLQEEKPNGNSLPSELAGEARG